LVAWNIFFPRYWECHHPNSSQLTNSYFSEGYTTNQKTWLSIIKLTI
jgi:hypothetical protein